MNTAILARSLPPFGNQKQLVKNKQSVSDIIKEIIEAHKLFAPGYDKIALSFDDGNTKKICDKLYSFCKQNIKYKVEPEEMQTTKSPAAILAQGFGDCKHYASFIGGVLDALNRAGKKIDWAYRFASYNLFAPEPEHIFVVAKINGRETWIDPTPGADKVTPVWQIDKKVKADNKMALYRISGIGASPESFPVNDLLDSVDYQSNRQLYMAIQLLLKYGILNANAKVNDGRLKDLQQKIDPKLFDQLVDARRTIQAAAIGNIFNTLWRGVKKVTLAAPRAAFLSLVAINAFGYATKLSKFVWAATGDYNHDNKDKIKKIWQDRLGGDWTKLQNTIRNGAKKKAILGKISGPEIPAWVTIAGACIAAIMPLVNAFLNKKKQEENIDYNIDPTTGLPYGNNPAESGDVSSDPIEFIKNNPLLLIGGAAAIYFLSKRKKSA